MHWTAKCPYGCELRGIGMPPDKITCQHGAGFILKVYEKDVRQWSISDQEAEALASMLNVDSEEIKSINKWNHKAQRWADKASVAALLDSIEGVR